jgi:PHP family Zn ribbon phosphoesterase
MSRVDALADRAEGRGGDGRVPFRNLIPLEEIIAAAFGSQPGTGAVREEYLKLVRALGGEFRVLLDAPLDDLARYTRPRVVEGVRRVREGRVLIRPGYDGVFGEIHVFGGAADEERRTAAAAQPAQTSLF